MSPGTVNNPTARALTRTWRLPILACCLVSAISLVMGPLLFELTNTAIDRAAEQRRALHLQQAKSEVAIRRLEQLICIFSPLVTQPPVREPGQTDEQFRRSLQARHRIILLLRGLDCGARLEELERGGDSKGVTPGGGNNPPSGQPSPPGPAPGGEQPDVHIDTPLTPPVDVCLPPRRPLCD